MKTRQRLSLLALPLAAITVSTSPANAAMRLKPKSTSAAPAPASAAGSTLANVARLTTATSTLSYSMSTTMNMTAGGKSINGTIVANGEMDKSKKAGRMTMDLGPYMSSIAASSGQPLPAALSDPTLFKMQMINIGSELWMSFPMLSKTSGVSNAKPWMYMNATELGVTPEQLAASQGADPSQGLQYLAGLGGQAKIVGTETVDGVPTTRYSTVVTLAALTKTSTPAQLAEIKKLFGDKLQLPVDVWIDAEGRARRLDMSMATNSAALQMTMKMSYKFGKFGEPVSISAPPADQVMNVKDVPALQQALTKRK